MCLVVKDSYKLETSSLLQEQVSVLLNWESPVCQSCFWENTKSKEPRQSLIFPNQPSLSLPWVYPDLFLYCLDRQDSAVEHPYRRWKRVEMPSTISLPLWFSLPPFLQKHYGSPDTKTEPLG